MTAIIPEYFTDFYDYNKYAAHIHELNTHWWQNPDGSPKELDKGERFMLMISELSEALEADRRDRADDKLPQYPGLWVELADTVIRVMDSGHVYGWDMDTQPQLEFLVKEPKTVGAKLLNITSEIIFLADYEINKFGLSLSVRAANIIHLCERFARECGCLDFWRVVYNKLIYNYLRADHKWEVRLATEGKKY